MRDSEKALVSLVRKRGCRECLERRRQKHSDKMGAAMAAGPELAQQEQGLEASEQRVEALEVNQVGYRRGNVLSVRCGDR